MGLSDRDITRPGVKLVIRSGSVSKLILKAMNEALPLVGDIYLKAAQKAVSLTDHDLAELRRLGYPYSRDGQPVHDDDRLIHTQSGGLRESLRVTSVLTTSRTISVQIVSTSAYIDFLIYGTRYMRPRRFHEKAYEDVKKIMWKPLLDGLAKVKYRISK